MTEQDFALHTRTAGLLWLLHTCLGLSIDELADMLEYPRGAIERVVRERGLRKWTGMVRDFNDDQLDAVLGLIASDDLLGRMPWPDRPSERMRLIRDELKSQILTRSVDLARLAAIGTLLMTLEPFCTLPDISLPYRKVA